MRMTDFAALAGTRVVRDGFMDANARCARAGIQLYSGADVGRPDMEVVRVWRSEDEVFRTASLDSFARLPITVDHPGGPVTATNWKELAVGATGGEVLRDGEYLLIGMRINDAEAIREVVDGKRELSVGYTAELEWGDGVTPQGERYDARQHNIVANHLAIVDRGRAGPLARIGDNGPAAPPKRGDDGRPGVDGGKDRKSWGVAPLTYQDKEAIMPDLKTVVLGDKAVKVDAADVSAIDAWKADNAKALADAKATHDAALAAKDAELAKKDAEIDDLKSKIVGDADLDKRVAARAELVGKARALVTDFDPSGKSDADIRKAVVSAKIGDAADGKSDEYIAARFDGLVESAPDAVRAALSGAKPINDKAGDAYQAMLDRTASAWKGAK